MDDIVREAWTWDHLNRAIPLYVGYRASDAPIADWRSVCQSLDSDVAKSIELKLLILLAELQEQQPNKRMGNSYRQAEWAVRNLEDWPNLDNVARKALIWVFATERQ